MRTSLHALILLASVLLTLEHVVAEAQQPTLETQRAARIQLDVGLLYEGYGRYAEAENAFAKAIGEGDAETSRIAKDGLRRVTALRGASTAAESQLALGRALEQQGRLADAEAAYAKAAEGGVLLTRAEALKHMDSIIKRRETFVEKHARPFFEAMAKTATPIFLLVLAFLFLPPPLRAVARRRQRNVLGVAGFGSGSENSFGNDIAYFHERMNRHFHVRMIAGNYPRMPVLVQSGGTEFVELLGAVSASSAPLVKWFLGLFDQPAYRITGTRATTDWEMHLRVKLQHKDETIAQWNRIYSISTGFSSQQDLAYEVLLALKRYVDSHPT